MQFSLDMKDCLLQVDFSAECEIRQLLHVDAEEGHAANDININFMYFSSNLRLPLYFSKHWFAPPIPPPWKLFLKKPCMYMRKYIVHVQGGIISHICTYINCIIWLCVIILAMKRKWKGYCVSVVRKMSGNYEYWL